MKAAIEAGWYCRKCGALKVFRADRGGLVTDVAYALWVAGNQNHVEAHRASGELVKLLKGGINGYGHGG